VAALLKRYSIVVDKKIAPTVPVSNKGLGFIAYERLETES
jgi:hypothetical protein